jgi:hypothetical protein
MTLSAGRAILTCMCAVILHVSVELTCGDRQGATRRIQGWAEEKLCRVIPELLYVIEYGMALVWLWSSPNG